MIENRCTGHLISGARDNIPDRALNASSSLHGFGTNESRLSLLLESVGWTALISDESPWIMANLEKFMVIQQVETLGNLAADSWVTSYMLCKTFFMNTIINKRKSFTPKIHKISDSFL